MELPVNEAIGQTALGHDAASRDGAIETDALIVGAGARRVAAAASTSAARTANDPMSAAAPARSGLTSSA
jgi:hypothetical protein